jgi:hypothetical protein
MKTLFATIASFLFAIQLTAQSTASATYFTQEGEKIWVIVDGIKQNNVASTNVKIGGLTRQNYRVKIIFEDETLKPIDHNLYVQDVESLKMMDVVHNIRKNKKGEHVVRISSFEEVPTPAVGAASSNGQTAQPAPQEVTFHAQEWSDDQYMQNVNIGIGGMGINTNVDVKESNDNVNMNINMSVPGMEGVNMNAGVKGSTTTTVYSSTTTTTTTTSSGGTKPAQVQQRPAQVSPTQPVVQQTNPEISKPASNNGCVRTADNTAISNITNSINGKSFASDKLKTAETFLKNTCVTTEQVKVLVKLFNFEGDKLSFAKTAFGRCVDKENYYMVADEFTFSSSSEELMEFIGAQ